MAANKWFKDVALAPPIEVFKLVADHNADTDAKKVNASVGAYRTDDGKPWVLPVVRAVESQMAADTTLNHEYLSVAGLPDFREASARLLLGSESIPIKENRVCGIQALGGTGALRVGMDFLKSRLNAKVILVSNPTWGNHKGIAKSLGYEEIRDYPYWDAKTRGLDFDGMKNALKKAPKGSVVVLHMVAHNPTGVDPTQEQWKELADLIEKQQLFPFFDGAYQGFASGDLDKDAWAVRYFADRGFSMFCAQSYSKNFGLYNERVGCLTVVCSQEAEKQKVMSQLELVVRTTWSNSSNHGARIVATVLNNPALYADWKDNVKTMADRILTMRKMLKEKLQALGTPGNWDHITSQIGMFSYTGLNAQQSKELTRKHHIYLLESGRISMCGLTTKNVEYVAQCIDDVVRNIVDVQKCC